MRDVGIRGTYARSFRPPSLYELYLPRTPVQQVDRRSAAQWRSVLAMQLVGGSPDLEATRGESYTAGIEFTPEALRPLALVRDLLARRDGQADDCARTNFALLHESDVAGPRVRAEPTAADLAAGIPGRVLRST